MYMKIMSMEDKSKLLNELLSSNGTMVANC